jgi:hypothetical protein
MAIIVRSRKRADAVAPSRISRTTRRATYDRDQSRAGQRRGSGAALLCERKEKGERFFFRELKFKKKGVSPESPVSKPNAALPDPTHRQHIITRSRPLPSIHKTNQPKNKNSTASAARPAAAARRPAVVVRAALPENNKPKFSASIPKVDIPKVDADEINAKVSQIGSDIAKAWDKTEEKPTAIFFAAVALVGLVAASSVVGTVERIPIIGDGLKLVGVGATAFFSYKYLVWPQDREQLVKDVKALFGKIGL